MAYGLLLEEMFGKEIDHGYLYFIPLHKAKKICFTKRMRKKLLTELEQMHRMLWKEQMPEATLRKGRCVSCEFRRFCNDVI